MSSMPLQCLPPLLAPLMSGILRLIGQHLKFDVQFLVEAGLPWPDVSINLFDTMLSCSGSRHGWGAFS